MFPWLMGFLPGNLMPLLKASGAVAGVVVVGYGTYLFLDARAATERARAELAIAQHNADEAATAFAHYRQFTEAGLAAAKRAQESHAATLRRYKPLRDQSHASLPSDDGPLPAITVSFLIGLRQLQSGVIAAPSSLDTLGPLGAAVLPRPAHGPATDGGSDPGLPTQ